MKFVGLLHVSELQVTELTEYNVYRHFNYAHRYINYSDTYILTSDSYHRYT